MTTPSATSPAKVAIVIPVFNQLHYTRQCLDSLNRAGVADGQIIIVNNASTDGTAEFLATRPQIRTINNAENRGCGFAWTQGAKLSDKIWTIVMNNDVLVPPGCIEGLISFAGENQCDLVSPAMCEGEVDYDFATHAADFMRRLKDARRGGMAHGVCFMVNRRVFESIGYFDCDPKLGGYEDDEYFRRARGAGFRLAITGRAFILSFRLHHAKKASRRPPAKSARVWATVNITVAKPAGPGPGAKSTSSNTPCAAPGGSAPNWHVLAARCGKNAQTVVQNLFEACLQPLQHRLSKRRKRNLIKSNT